MTGFFDSVIRILAISLAILSFQLALTVIGSRLGWFLRVAKFVVSLVRHRQRP